MQEVWGCLRDRGDHVVLSVVVTPNAPLSTTAGLHDGHLRVRIAAVAVDGRANEALISWLARDLGLPAVMVTLLRGNSARRKQVRIDAPHAVVAAWLAARLKDPAPPDRSRGSDRRGG